jgi:uncharacterized membrane protein YfcA
MTQPILAFLLAIAVGALSSVLGLGGGILLVPIFTLVLKLPIHQAIALSLCCVMATSVTSSRKYLASGLIDLKAVLLLESTTIIGSYVAGKLAGSVPENIISLIFSGVLIATAVVMLIQKQNSSNGTNPHPGRYPLVMGASVFAGGLVGLLGVGGGIVKVPLLQIVLGKTVKEAVAASAMMVGISAAVAIIPYLSRGDVPVTWVPFATLGTILGAYLGSSLFHKIESAYIKFVFAAVLLYTAGTMIYKGLK